MGSGTSQATSAHTSLHLAAYLTRKLNVRLPDTYQEDDARKHLARLAQSIYFDFLFSSGGLLHRPIPRAGEAVTLSLWEACPAASLSLGPQASILLESLQQALLEPERSCHISPPSPDNGEVFLYHAMYQLLQQDRTLRRWVSALQKSSPLTRLLRFPVVPQHPIVAFADGQEGRPSLTTTEFDGLLAHPALPYLLGTIADHWSDIPWPQPRKDYEAQLERLNARRATLQVFLERCARAEKLSLTVVFPMMYMRLLAQDYAQQALQIQQLKQWKLSLREQMLTAYIGLLDTSQQLDQLILEQVIEPGAYGWSRPEEVRVLMQTYGKKWTSSGLSQQVQHVRQLLRGHLG